MAAASLWLGWSNRTIHLVGSQQAMPLDQHLTGVGGQMAAWAACNDVIEGL